MFQLANGGTIFLDEIGEMSATLQVKLLRVLQDREIRPVGADRTVKVDVRVIAATNKDLARGRDGPLPRGPLLSPAGHPDRAAAAARAALGHPAAGPALPRQAQRQARRPCRVTITDEAMVHLWEYDWPGNVRELENLLERLVILCEDGCIRVENLPPNIRSFISEKKIPRPTLTEEGLDLNRAVEEFENRLIDEALRRTKGNKQAAARLLGLKRTTLVAKLRAQDRRRRRSRRLSDLIGAAEGAMHERTEDTQSRRAHPDRRRRSQHARDPAPLAGARRLRDGAAPTAAAACLEALGKEPVDVILLDVMMPDMDGFQVCERLRENDGAGARSRSILLTAKDDMETRSRGMQLGVSEFLTKPVNKHELFARLQAQLHSRELERRMDATAATVAGLAKK